MKDCHHVIQSRARCTENTGGIPRCVKYGDHGKTLRVTRHSIEDGISAKPWHWDKTYVAELGIAEQAGSASMRHCPKRLNRLMNCFLPTLRRLGASLSLKVVCLVNDLFERGLKDNQA
jgi:hypothetical protein